MDLRNLINQVLSSNDKIATQALQRLSDMVNKAAVASAGPNYSHWTQDLVADTKKRGLFQGAEDLTNPIIQNPNIYPYAEPVISAYRTGYNQLGRSIYNANPQLGNLYHDKLNWWALPYNIPIGKKESDK